MYELRDDLLSVSLVEQQQIVEVTKFFGFRGAKSINKSLGDHYNTSVLNSILTILGDIKQVKSAAGLHWMLSLLMKVTKKDSENVVANKCVSILKEVR